MRNFVCIIVFFICVSAYQAKSAVGEWTSLSHSKFRVHTSWENKFEPKIAVEIRFKSGWHSYFHNPGDSGASLKLELSSDPAGVSVADFNYPIPEHYSSGPIVNYVYNHDLFLPITLKVKDQSNYDLSLSLEYLVCENSCVPQFADTKISIRPSIKSPEWDSISSQNNYANRTIEGVYEKSEKNLILRFPRVSSLVEFYPEFNIFTPGTQVLSAQANGSTYLKFALSDFSPRSFYALLRNDNEVLRGNFSEGKIGTIPSNFTPISIQDHAKPELNHDYGLVLIMAFIGGLLLNFMPCIFPVIALKLMHLVNLREESKNSSASTSLNAWMYLVGIIFSFLLLGISLEFLRQGGAQIGWGFQLQNPAFVACMALLFYIISLNLAGLFEINISVTTKAGEEQGPLQSFITGVLACVVATPCTAPFMATALGYALFLDSQVQRMLLFIFMGFGMAFPVWLIEMFPSLRGRCIGLLPKPGPWMLNFRRILAYPMLLASAWLLWVLAQQTTIEDLFVSLLILILMTATLQMYQASFYWRSIWRKILFFGVIFQFIILVFHFNPNSMSSNSEKFSYQKFNRQDLESYVKKGNRIFVIATADWCVSCKVNERLVIKTEVMEQFYREHDIQVMIADWTKYDSEITKYLSSFNRAGVPLYVIYQDGKSQILPQILTKDIVRDSIVDLRGFNEIY